MNLLLEGALLADPRENSVRSGTILIQAGEITAIDPSTGDIAGAERIDCTGRIIMPALVNGHTHLYSALALGMPPPRTNPENFAQILEHVWWKLDSVLDEESIYMSALAGAARAALCGCGTLIDHHASPNAIQDSLDRIRDGLATIGLRGILCYETTDRHGREGARAGIRENARFLADSGTSGMYAGMAGGHASFTMSDESLRELAEIAQQYGAGVHIHCAEDPLDIEDARKRGATGVIERFEEHGILRPETLLAHCTHLDQNSIRRAYDAGCWIAHNTRSNMNNAVGYADIEAIASGNAVLGTDGIDNDVFAESQTSYFKIRDARAAVSMTRCMQMPLNAARLAGGRLGVQLGSLQAGAAADLVILKYDGYVPVSDGNLAGHWFFGFNSRHVESLIVGGKWVVRDYELTSARAKTELEECAAITKQLWERFEM